MTRLPALALAGLIAAALLAAPAPAPAAPPEVRGTWLTTTANDAISTPAKTAETMARLREIGLNTVYVECWKNGYTEFPSETMREAIGVPIKVNAAPPDLQRDLLGECVAEAHRNGLACVAWFEYGFMAAFRDTHNELRARRDWLVLDQDGNDVAKNGFVWMNPLHPDAQALLVGIVIEAVKKYDLDGVQLDDRIVWPGLEMGYDDYTKSLYAADHAGAEPPTDIHDAEWKAWRQRKVEEAAKRFVAAVRAANPDVLVSLSPGPHPWALDNYLIDWPAWDKWEAGGWDEYVPQIYRMNYARFAEDLPVQIAALGEDVAKKKLIPGIRVVGDGPNLSWPDLKRSIELTREIPTAGHCLWFSRGVLEVYPEQLKAFYDVEKHGTAANPLVMARPDTRPHEARP